MEIRYLRWGKKWERKNWRKKNDMIFDTQIINSNFTIFLKIDLIIPERSEGECTSMYKKDSINTN